MRSHKFKFSSTFRESIFYGEARKISRFHFVHNKDKYSIHNALLRCQKMEIYVLETINK